MKTATFTDKDGPGWTHPLAESRTETACGITMEPDWEPGTWSTGTGTKRSIECPACERSTTWTPISFMEAFVPADGYRPGYEKQATDRRINDRLRTLDRTVSWFRAGGLDRATAHEAGIAAVFGDCSARPAESDATPAL